MKPSEKCIEYRDAITVEQMRQSDKYTIENLVPSKELMCRAAMGIYNSCNWENKKIAIVAGSGNNGGDGYALAVILKENGISAHIYRISEKFSDDGLYYFNMTKDMGVQSEVMTESTSFASYDIVVDCILGTGFEGTPRGMAADAIHKINASDAFVVSADINSGLNGNTGEAVLAVKSDLTVSIGYYKKGMFTKKAPELIGELVNVDIGIVLV